MITSEKKENRKVIIFALDGVPHTILNQLMKEGYMNFLNNIILDGTYINLESTIPSNSPTAWSGFLTGSNPGENGIYDFSIYDKQKNRFNLSNSELLNKTIWEYASDKNIFIGSINVPMTYPIFKVNGILISGILTPSDDSDFVYPKSLKKILNEEFNYSYIGDINKASKYDPNMNPYTLINVLKNNIQKRFDITNYLISNYDFDILMMHFIETDTINHALWDYMDENCELYDENIKEYIYKNIYDYIDKKINDIKNNFIKKIDDECLIIIMSDHGMEKHKYRYNIGNWLYQNEYLNINLYPFFYIAKFMHIFIYAFLKIVKENKVFSVYKILKKIESKLIKMPLTHKTVIRNSLAYSSGFHGEGYIHILNEIKYDDIKKELKYKLMNVKNPISNEYIIKDIYEKEEIYSGKKINLMPDLTIIPNKNYSITGKYNPFEENLHIVNIYDDYHIGKHNYEGILIINDDINLKSKLKITDLLDLILTYIDVSRARS